MWTDTDREDGSPIDEAQHLNEAAALEQREAKRLASRPVIDHLADAVVAGPDGRLTFLPKVGDRVVIERVSTLTKSKQWLDTRVWVVNGVDPKSGRVDLWCDDLNQNGVTNFIVATQAGGRFKLVPQKGPIFARKREQKPAKAEE